MENNINYWRNRNEFSIDEIAHRIGLTGQYIVSDPSLRDETLGKIKERDENLYTLFSNFRKCYEELLKYYEKENSLNDPVYKVISDEMHESGVTLTNYLDKHYPSKK